MKRRLRTLLIILLACLALAATGMGLILGTEKGRQGLLNAIARVAAGPDFTLRMEGLRLGESWSLKRMTIGDASGPWLDGENLRVRPVLAELAGGRIHLLHAGIGRLEINRLPGSRAPEEKQGSSDPFLPPLRIQVLDIDHLRLGPDVVGHEALLSVHGSLTLDAEPRAALRVARLDRDEDSLELDARHNPAAKTLDLRLDLHEGPQGLLHAALGVNGTRGISVKASGQGPLEAWGMSIQASLSDVASLSGNATLDLDTAPGARLHVLITPGPEWGPFTGLPQAETGITARAQWEESVLRVNRLELRNSMGALDGNATWDLANNILRAEADARDVNLAWLLPEDVQTGPIHASATLLLDSRGLRAQGHAALREALVSGYPVPEADVRLDLDLPAGSDSWRALAQLKTHLPDMPEGLRSWTADATLGQDKDTFVVDALRLESERLGLAANGTLGALVNVDARFDVRQLPLGEASPSLSATVDASLTGRLDPAASAMNASLEAAASRIEGLPAMVMDLLGPEVGLLADIGLSPQRLRVREATLRSRTTARAGAEFNLQDNTFTVRLDASLPQLRIDALHVPGGATAQVSASGDTTSFDLDLSVAAATIGIQDMALDSLTAKVSAKDLPGRPTATVHAAAMVGREPVNLDLRVEPVQSRVRLAEAALRFPDASLRFSGELDPATMVLVGDADFHSTDLRALGRILGTRLGGECSLQARLDAAQGRQRASLKGRGKSLVAGGIAVDAASVHGRVADPGLPGGTDVQIDLRAVDVAGVPVEQFSARVRGLDSGLGVTFDLAHSPYQTRLATSATLSSDLTRLVVEDLRGTLLNQDLRLLSPIDVSASAAGATWRETGLSFGPATLRTRGNVSRDRADIGADLTDFDPALLRPLLPNLPGASVNARLSVQGPPSEPDALLRVQARDLRLDAPDVDQLPDLDATAELHLRRGMLEAQGSLTSKSDVNLDARLSSPMPVNLLAPKFMADAPVSGQLTGKAKLLLLPRLLHLDDQTLDGNCDLDFRIAGTWENPQLTGVAQVRGARYENFRSGTILQQVDMDARAEGSTLTLKLNATDGGDGKAEAVGQVDLLTFRHIFDVLFDRFRLLRQDLVQSTAKGGLRLQGDLEGSELLGSMTLDPTTIRLPSKIPPDLAHIEVMEINTGKPPSPAEKAPSFLLGFDLKVAVPARMTVEGRGLESEWSGNLHVGGNHVQPVVSGEMRLLRGKFDFLDRTFDLTKGRVSLGGESPPNPFLDVQGETRILENLILVSISGPARDFRLSLTSVPALPQDELLAMILFGRSLRQISPLQAVRLAQAAAEMAGLGGATPDFLDSIKSSLGLQEVDVSRDDQDNTAVGIGGYVGGKYYIRTQSNVSGQDRTRVEIQITPRISVETEVGADSRQGGGVMWKHDY